MKKKVVSLLLAAAMTTAALAGCGSSNGSSSSDASTGADSTSATSASASTDGEKKDAAGEKIAMITDSGDITDESFNQITWETAYQLHRSCCFRGCYRCCNARLPVRTCHR